MRETRWAHDGHRATEYNVSKVDRGRQALYIKFFQGLVGVRCAPILLSSDATSCPPYLAILRDLWLDFAPAMSLQPFEGLPCATRRQVSAISAIEERQRRVFIDIPLFDRSGYVLLAVGVRCDYATLPVAFAATTVKQVFQAVREHVAGPRVLQVRRNEAELSVFRIVGNRRYVVDVSDQPLFDW